MILELLVRVSGLSFRCVHTMLLLAAVDSRLSPDWFVFAIFVVIRTGRKQPPYLEDARP